MALNDPTSVIRPAGTGDLVYVQALLNNSWRWNVIESASLPNRTVQYVLDDSWTSAERTVIGQAFATYSAVANINFQAVGSAANAQAEIVLVRTDREGLGGFNGYSGTPFDARESKTATESVGGYPAATFQLSDIGRVHTYFAMDGKAFAGTGANQGIEPGRGGFAIIVHELGHALGLKHPHDYGAAGYTVLFPGVSFGDVADAGTNNLNQPIYSMMSENNANKQFPGQTVGPMAFDIAALHHLYGPRANKGGDTTYLISDSRTDPQGWQCIWDTGGTDTIRYDGSHSTFIDLRPATLNNSPTGGGVVSYAYTLNSTGGQVIAPGGYTIAGDYSGFIADRNGVRGVIIEDAIGGQGSDQITGNDVDNFLRGRSGDDTILGLGGNDTLNGGLDDDTLDGGLGSDRMIGGAGSDIFVVDNAGDRVTDGGNDGALDTVRTTLRAYALDAPDVEALEYIGDNTFTGVGNSLNNTISGGRFGDTLVGLDGDDVLRGRNGADTLQGGRGSDRLDGGLGADFMFGGDGNDTYVVGQAGDQVVETSRVLGGIDTVLSTLGTYTLGNNVENLRFDGSERHTGTGNNLDNLIIGGANRDVLSGLQGNDTLMGRGGADTLNGGQGSDTADYSIETGNVVANLVLGTAVTNGVVDRLISIENLTAGLGNDTFTGNAGDNTFTYVGAYAVDIDTGGLDSYAGGAGTDTLDLSRLFESGGADLQSGLAFASFSTPLSTGTKTIATLVSIENVTGSNGADALLGSDMENVLLGGLGNDRLSGRAGADRLDGGAGDDTLDGGAGSDTLIGGAGSDTFVVSGPVAGLGSDTVFGGSSTVDDRLDVDTIDFSGLDGSVVINLSTQLFVATSGGISVTSGQLNGIERVVGSAFNDAMFSGAGRGYELSGGDGNDQLDGADGIDILNGGEGDDIIIADNLAEDVIDGGNGFDQIYASVETIANGFTFTLTAAMNVEGLSGSNGNDRLDAGAMSWNMYMIGYDGNDWMHGGSGEDFMIGDAYPDSPAGDDIMYGGAGSDQMYGYNGNDTMYGGGSNLAVGYGDRLFGGAGDDTLYGGGEGLLVGEEGDDVIVAAFADLVIGGEGDDTITCAGGTALRIDVLDSGHDIVNNFTASDGIWFIGATGITGMDDLQIADGELGAVINYGSPTVSASITLVGVAASALSAADFTFS